MHSIQRHRRVVFTRWTRKAAAAFHSRKLVVNIGCLKTNVLNQITKKCSVVIAAFTSCEIYTQDNDFFDEEPPEETLLIVTTPILATASIPCPQRHQSITHNFISMALSF